MRNYIHKNRLCFKLLIKCQKKCNYNVKMGTTIISIDNKFKELIEICLTFLTGNKDKAKKDLVTYMNENKNEMIKTLLNFLKLSADDLTSNLKALPNQDRNLKAMIQIEDKHRLDIFIISNISGTTAGELLPEFNNIYLVQQVIRSRTYSVNNTFLIKFLLRGLRNNSFLNAVKRNIHNLNHNIIKLLIRLITVIRITFTNDSALTNQLIKSESMRKFEVELVKKILKEANSPFLIQQDEEELNKIKKMQKKLDKLFKILNNEEVSYISLRSNSSSYKVLDKKNFDAYTLFEHLINFDDTVAHLIERKDLELKKCKDNVKEFSLTEFDKYLNSDKDTYFIRKYENKCYGFTPDDFFAIYHDMYEFD